MRAPISRRTAITLATAAFTLGIPLGAAIGGSSGFSDVPTSNAFYADIEALASSGVTTGCGGGKFCPKDTVTREQMAAFMNRLGALQAGKTPVVNADKVDGVDGSQILQYGTTAPAGATLTGSFGGAGTAAAGDEVDNVTISFPVPISSAPTAHVIRPGQSLPAGCTGSLTQPGAQPGHVCVFVGHEVNVVHSYTLFSPLTGVAGASPYGVQIELHTAGPGSYVVSGSWAVTGG